MAKRKEGLMGLERYGYVQPVRKIPCFLVGEILPITAWLTSRKVFLGSYSEKLKKKKKEKSKTKKENPMGSFVGEGAGSCLALGDLM